MRFAMVRQRRQQPPDEEIARADAIAFFQVARHLLDTLFKFHDVRANAECRHGIRLTANQRCI